jgi:uncharacterized protein YndB with AHSA1/START domain
MTTGEGGAEAATDLAIRKSIRVEAPVERAFDVFTRGIARWWPVETHSVGAMRDGSPPQELHLELREGGRFYEVSDGVEHTWGRVLVYEPPRRIAIEWRVNPASPATEIDVTFAPEDGGTRVDLVHRGWERFDDPGHATRSDYDAQAGWDAVLGRFAAATAV